MKAKNFLALFFMAPFVIAQLIIAPIAVVGLMLKGIFSENPRKKVVSKYAMTTKVALVSNKS